MNITFNRELIEVILKKFDQHEIVFLLGTRQTGKTTLSRLLAQYSEFSDDNTLFIDFEDKSFRESFNNTSLARIKHLFALENIELQSSPLKQYLVIFDEIQLLDDPSNLLKLLHDHFPQLKIIATGSSSLEIKNKFSDSLAGRKQIFKVEPLSFDEFLLFKGEEKLLKLRQIFKESIKGKIHSDQLISKVNDLAPLISSYSTLFLDRFEEYLIYGGYPEVVLSSGKEQKIQKLDSIATAYIQKDIRDIARIDNIKAYNQLLQYIAVNSGAQFNLSSVKKIIGISSETLNKYLNLLEETFIIAELPPFFTNKNKEISKSKKYYYKDTGVNNLQLNNFNPLNLRSDAGALYENYIYNTLEHNKSILSQNYFYRTQSKSEIDFIHINETQHTLIEVKSGVYTKIPRAVYEFEKKYQQQLIIQQKLVINRQQLMVEKEVLFMPAYLF